MGTKIHYSIQAGSGFGYTVCGKNLALVSTTDNKKDVTCRECQRKLRTRKFYKSWSIK